MRYYYSLSLNNDQINLCEKDLSETDLYNAMKNMHNNKSSGNDELDKDFMKAFGVKLKNCLSLLQQKQNTEVN